MTRQAPFDFKDQIFVDLDFIRGAFALLYYTDKQKLRDNKDDFDAFCNGLAWYTEMVKEDIKRELPNFIDEV